MSQHPSLRVGSVGVRHRNVLKRFERLKRLMEDNKWDETKSVFALPKVKSQKIKVKKVKAEGEEKPKTEGAQTAAEPQAAQGKAPAQAAKGAQQPKTAGAPKAEGAKGGGKK